ncbi:aldo/keto reductase [Amnibacterium sp. CER49]|uniref:aldo/keto reductase n=1 Tax=Amnibacterium sp. CER49 TaxID=3039161 RepID=UPI002449CB6A|nr:aldo/keto reductase [Amnibacterium sp. CER49]MDH2444295.1 aldo/keto reductase [Amnibacterium sp. CER49]
MLYRNLGASGLRVSAVGLGGNNFGRTGTATITQEGTDAVVNAALEAGVNLIDTADVYGAEYGTSERLLGASLAGRRDQVVLATKFGHADIPSPIPAWGARGSRRYVRLAVEGSLQRLQTDWIDLYQLHTPDPLTPIEETIDALDELVTEGKIRYFGHSNLAGWQIAEAHLTSLLRNRRAFVSAQNEYNLLARGAEAEVLPAARRFGLGFLPYFPFVNGLFTGKFSRDGGPADSRIVRQRPHILDEAPWDAIESLDALARGRGSTLLEVTVAWLLAHEELSSVIAGATTPEQVRQNAAAAGAEPLTAEERAAVEALFPA